MLKLQVIVGSTRPTRASDQVVPWVVERTTHHDAFEVEVLDLRDWPMPFFQEHAGTIGDFTDPTFSDPVVKAWNARIAEGDAYLVVTPEYNHSIPGVLKNALDNIFITHALRNKPISAVSYSGGAAAGVRAIEHLALIAIEFEMAPIRQTVITPTCSTPSTRPATPPTTTATSPCRSRSTTWPGGARPWPPPAGPASWCRASSGPAPPARPQPAEATGASS